MDQTIISFLDLSLGLWSDRCDILNGITNKDDKTKEHQKLQKEILWCFDRRDEVDTAQQHIFDVDVHDLCKRQSLQYLKSWLHSFSTAAQLAANQEKQDQALQQLEGNLQVTGVL